jgi:monoamine oxidase
VKSRKSEEPAPLNWVHVSRGVIPTWWTTSPARTNRITAWAGGPQADALFNHEPGTQVHQVLDALASALAVPRARLDSLFERATTHDWRADPFSRAAYTFVGVHGSASQERYAKPVEGTLFFAGEAADPEQTGTVAGALASGHWAAKHMQRTLQARLS